jgi:hypothetical protein
MVFPARLSSTLGSRSLPSRVAESKIEAFLVVAVGAVLGTSPHCPFQNIAFTHPSIDLRRFYRFKVFTICLSVDRTALENK